MIGIVGASASSYVRSGFLGTGDHGMQTKEHSKLMSLSTKSRSTCRAVPHRKVETSPLWSYPGLTNVSHTKNTSYRFPVLGF